MLFSSSTQRLISLSFTNISELGTRSVLQFKHEVGSTDAVLDKFAKIELESQHDVDGQSLERTNESDRVTRA